MSTVEVLEPPGGNMHPNHLWHDQESKICTCSPPAVIKNCGGWISVETTFVFEAFRQRPTLLRHSAFRFRPSESRILQRSFQDTGNANKFNINQMQTKVNIPLFKRDPTCVSSSKLKPWWVLKFGLSKFVQVVVPSLVWASTSSKWWEGKFVGPVVAWIPYCWISRPFLWVVC
jgi:hypothetical protein